MEIDAIKLNPIQGAVTSPARVDSPSGKVLGSFTEVFDQTINKVSELQKSADMAVEKFAAGELDVHEVMIAVEKASVAMQLTIQLRNKVMEAYQEVMRMQV
jgi:flagellar hook-basal body complex protein FliE